MGGQAVDFSARKMNYSMGTVHEMARRGRTAGFSTRCRDSYAVNAGI
jgi:hypothetical protein